MIKGIPQRHNIVARMPLYGAIAKDALAMFPDDDHRRALNDSVNFYIKRAY